MLNRDELDTAELPVLVPARDAVGFSSRVQVDLGALSHLGRVRTNNEDHYLVARFDRAMQLLLSNLPPGYGPNIRTTETGYALLVADGMGGAAAGEVASRTAISALVDLILRAPNWIMRLDDASASEMLRRIGERFRSIRETLVEEATADPSLQGMGTTLTMAGSIGADLVIGHVGDSRAYLMREGRLLRLTRDDTMAQVLVDRGLISAEEVATHPMRHMLTDVVGTKGGEARAELHRWRLQDEDQVLLCTDGLTDMVSDEVISSVLLQPGSAAEACRSLVDLALEGGGEDNVTVVLSRYRIPDESKTTS